GLDFVTVLTAAMAWFIVGNVMLMNVTERRRGLALLRLVGATGATIRRLVVREAAVLGGVGAALGAAGGIVAARPIASGISRALDVPSAAVAATPGLVAAAVAAGVCGAVAAAWWPARDAATVDLLEGLAGASRPPAPGAAVRSLVAAAVLVASAAGVLGAVITGWLPPRAAVAASVLMLVAFVTVTAAALGPVAAGLGALVPRRWRTEAALAIGQITRRSVRTALTSGVLVVAVTNGIGLGHAIRDNVDDIRGWFGRALRADWILTRAGPRAPSGPVDSGAAAAIRAVPGVERVEGLGIAGGRVAGSACVVVARDVPDDEPLPFAAVMVPESEVRAALARGEAVAGTLLARRTGIRPGDEVVVDVLGRSTRIRVAALVIDYTSGGGSLVLRSDAAARLLGLGADNVLLVRAAAGRMEDLRSPLAEAARDRGFLLRSFADERRRVDGMVDGVVGSLWAILVLGFGVGSLGVANTVTMNVVEQTRSLGLLRAVGMTGGQVSRMIVLQSAAIGAAGGMIGLVGGLTTSAFIQAASQPLLGHPIRFTFRPDIVAGTLAATLAVSVLAAWLPARRALRLDVLDAITIE
ncbi:MAG: ABC transporter permease, partial [Planctomycetaceae bacterium]